MICDRVGAALLARLQPDEEAAGIGGCALPVLPMAEPTAAMSGSFASTSPSCTHQPRHLLRRDVLRGFGEAGDQAGVLDREEALGDGDE